MSISDQKKGDHNGDAFWLDGPWSATTVDAGGFSPMAATVDTGGFSPINTGKRGDWRVLGRRWLDFLYKMFRAIEESDQDTALPTVLLEEWQPLSRQLLFLEAPSVLCGYGGIFYLNRKRLLFRTEDWSRMHYVQQQLSARGWGGIRLQANTTDADLQQLLTPRHTAATNHHPQTSGDGEAPNSETQTTQVLPPNTAPVPQQGDAGSAPVAWISLAEAKQRWEHWSREEEGRMLLRTTRPEQHAVWLYGRLMQWVQRRYNPLEQRPPQHQAHAILRSLIRLCERWTLLFFGFHMPDELTAYQSYHVTNTAVLSLMFGQTLGLSRQQCLELGWAALEHDIGKLSIPAQLLHKTEPLSAAEIKQIEQLPIHTVKRLVGREFAWERLKQALISMDIRLRPVSSARNGAGQPAYSLTDEPSLVMSRIISLCACFDALCSERPFRPAMKPVDALALMRGPLAQQFDTILLQRFVAFVWPVIKACNLGDQSKQEEPAKDLRPLSAQMAPPVLQELQRELQEYRTLKQVRQLTPEQQHRLQWLQRFLALKLRSTMPS